MPTGRVARNSPPASALPPRAITCLGRRAIEGGRQTASSTVTRASTMKGGQRRTRPFSTMLPMLTRAHDADRPRLRAEAPPPAWTDGMRVTIARAALALGLLAGSIGAAQADRIKNPTAVFSGLDKITGRIVSFEVATGETVQFGSLQMTPRVCYTRPPTESPNTTTFVEVDEVGLDNKYRRVFTGWMFASSPGLHGIEHPVYDIWLVECKGGTEVIAEPKET